MLPGLGNGRLPQELTDDPIERSPEAGESPRARPRANPLLGNRSSKSSPISEIAIPSSFESYAPEGSEEIPIPYIETVRPKMQPRAAAATVPPRRAKLNGFVSPRTYGKPGTANTGLKRKQSDTSAFEEAKAEERRRKSSKNALNIDDGDEDELNQIRPTNVVSGPGAGSIREAQRKAAERTALPQNEVDLSDDELSTQPRELSPAFSVSITRPQSDLSVVVPKKTEAQKPCSSARLESLSSELGKHALGKRREPLKNPITLPQMVCKNKGSGRPIISHTKSWELLCYQEGTKQMDTETSGPLALECTVENSKELTFWERRQGRRLVLFTFAKVLEVWCCPDNKWFGFKLRSTHSPCAFLTLKFQKHVDEVLEKISEVQDVKSVNCAAMQNFVLNAQAWGERKKMDTLVHDPLHTQVEKALDAYSNEELAQKLQELESLRRSRRTKQETGSAEDLEVVEPEQPAVPVTRQTRTTRTTSKTGGPTYGRTSRRTSIYSDLSLDETPNLKTQPALKMPPPWKQPLSYPFEGKGRTCVEHYDLQRLGPTEFLNDNIINFYLSYIEQNLKEKNPALHQETHFFNTFFFERLSTPSRWGMRGDKQKNMDTVLRWTAKVDLFEKNYIIIPINESSHWYLAIICNLQHLKRKFPNPEAATDSDSGTTAADPENAEATTVDSPGSTEQQTSVEDVDKMDIEKDPEVAETQESFDRMSVSENDEGEWPISEETPAIDSNLAEKNKGVKRNRMSLVDLDLEELNSKISSRESSPKPKKLKKAPGRNHAQSPTDPAIIILDSMGIKRDRTVAKLKDWLIHEAQVKRSLEIPKSSLKGTHPKAPVQDNYHDCGLFILHYIEIFLENHEQLIKSFLARDNTLDQSIWRAEEIRNMRVKMFNLICGLQKEYDTLYPVTKKNKKGSSKSPPNEDESRERSDSPEITITTPAARRATKKLLPEESTKNEDDGENEQKDSPAEQIMQEAAAVKGSDLADDEADDEADESDGTNGINEITDAERTATENLKAPSQSPKTNKSRRGFRISDVPITSSDPSRESLHSTFFTRQQSDQTAPAATSRDAMEISMGSASSDPIHPSVPASHLLHEDSDSDMVDVIHVRSSLFTSTSNPVNNTTNSPMEDRKMEANAEDDGEMLSTTRSRKGTPLPVHIGPARDAIDSVPLKLESRGMAWTSRVTSLSRNVASEDKSSSKAGPEGGEESGSNNGSGAEEGNEVEQDEDLQIIKVKRAPTHFDRLAAMPTVSPGRSSFAAHIISSDPSEPEQNLPELQVPDSQPEYYIPPLSSSVTEGESEIKGDGTAQRPEVIEDSQPNPVPQASSSQDVDHDNQDTAKHRDRYSNAFMESSQEL
ncbi:hypothetical protein BZA77DRAFT_46436 [Pyronema omphalodes]|nr:hypothetical protein BZA77DRAFT_46436 [Pyronema omphalodes]